MDGLIWYLQGETGSFRPKEATSIIDTYPFPPKTAVIGMIGAALGLSEKQLLPYYDKIKVGIKIQGTLHSYNDLMRIWKLSESAKKEKWVYFHDGKIYAFAELKKKLKSKMSTLPVREIFVVVKRFLYHPKFTIYILIPENNRFIVDIKKALLDPVYPITLGDSDSLFYPQDMNYVEIVKNIRKTRAQYFECILSTDIVDKAGGLEFSESSGGLTIYPQFKTMPVRFEAGRKVTMQSVICFKGVVKVKHPIEAYDFKGEPIFLF